MLDLSSMNAPQREAVETTEGPLLVLAGAGSGKTRVLTLRIAYLIDAGLAGPTNILAMTFTNKAAGEMKERIARILTDPASYVTAQTGDTSSSISDHTISGGFILPWMGTFHSICVKILKRYGELVGLSRNFTIYDSSDQQSAIKEAMKNLHISIKECNPRAIASYISSAKNELVTADAYKSFAEGYFQGVVAEVYPEYQSILKGNNAVDFDDLIMYTIILLKENPKVLTKLQEDFKYILVDEYQDTNHAQYILVNMLAEKYRNICCVGDDDQSIYSFRGATIKNILSFEKDYPESKVIKLEQNYRSTKTILEAAHNVIQENRNRKEKKLWTDNEDGEKIAVFQASDEIREGEWITEQIIRYTNGGGDYQDVAVLYRTNAQSRALEEAFINAGVAYRIIGGTRFYERKEIKDVLSYLKLLYNPKDNNSLERIINTPRRGIGEKTYLNLLSEATAHEMSPFELLSTNYELHDVKLQGFKNVVLKLHTAAEELQIVDLINFVLKQTGYIEMLEDGTSESEARIENIKELITVASKFDSLEPHESLEGFLDEVSLLEGIAEEGDLEEKSRVTIMTIHAAKGLEFPHVFVVGMEENLFPHANSIYDDKEIEEERRLAYVAITRAKEHLYLTHAKSRKYFGSMQSNPISRFISSIDTELIQKESDFEDSWIDSDHKHESARMSLHVDLQVGDSVKHEYFGVGKVLIIDDETIEVDFGAAYGVKELMLEYARLEKV